MNHRDIQFRVEKKRSLWKPSEEDLQGSAGVTQNRKYFHMM